MRRLAKYLLIVMLVLGGALAWTFTAALLPVPAEFEVSMPTPHAPDDLQIFAIPAGSMQSRAMLAYRGGGFGDQRTFGMGAILVRHPQGDVLFDAGFGHDVAAHVRTTPRLMQWTSDYSVEPTVAVRLQQAGIDLHTLRGVVLTHAHWDHVSGLADLPGVPVWINADELGFVQSGDASTALARQLGTGNYHVYSFNDGAYLGFGRSHDLFGDGSVVLVEAAGHTPGSIIAFINFADGRRYALVGDLVWQKEGIDLPAERPWASRVMVDADAEAVRQLIVRMHQLQQRIPGLVIVPAHDRRVWDTLPQLAQVESMPSE